MKRRDFIAGTAALLVLPRRSWALGMPRRVGYLDPVIQNAPLYKVWQDSLRDHGWIEGKNLIIDSRSAEGHAERLPPLAAELVALKPDLLVGPSPGRFSPEIGNGYHSDYIRGRVRSRGDRPCPKLVAPGWQHNGSCDLRSRRLDRKTNRNFAGTSSRRLENRAVGQSRQPNPQASIGQ